MWWIVSTQRLSTEKKITSSLVCKSQIVLWLVGRFPQLLRILEYARGSLEIVCIEQTLWPWRFHRFSEIPLVYSYSPQCAFSKMVSVVSRRRWLWRSSCLCSCKHLSQFDVAQLLYLHSDSCFKHSQQHEPPLYAPLQRAGGLYWWGNERGGILQSKTSPSDWVEIRRRALNPRRTTLSLHLSKICFNQRSGR